MNSDHDQSQQEPDEALPSHDMAPPAAGATQASGVTPAGRIADHAVVGDTPVQPPVRVSATQSDAEIERQMRRMSRRSFLWGAVAVGTGLGGLRWLIRQREVDGAP